MPPIPPRIATERLVLRSWQPHDAARLLPILQSNVARLSGWIPEFVASPAPLPELEERLRGFADDFAATRACRYGVFSPDEQEIFGEADLFFRSPAGRVPLDAADCAEIGYWLRGDVTGRGYATEAARAMLNTALHLPRVAHVEIRCDARNAASVAVAQRLGFHLAAHTVESHQMLWVHQPGGAGGEADDRA